MSTAAAGPFAARELLDLLVDDAAVYPPGNASLATAVPAHLEHRQGAAAAGLVEVVGPFLCPASRLGELRGLVDPGSALDLRVVVDTGVGGIQDAVDAVGRHDVPMVFADWGLEVPLRADTDLGGAARRLAAALRAANAVEPVFVEVPRAPSAPAALDVLAEEGLLAKLRTGGADASAFPTEDEVAGFVLACLDRELGFKCTAGLHHAVRNTDPVHGFEQHGFLNIMLAVSVALAGGDRELVAAELADRDTRGVADRIRQLSPDRARVVRSWFRSYGSCSVTDPIDELVALGLLDPAPSIVKEQQ